MNGWTGSGYAILDAEYGVGAYKISGGASGGELYLKDSNQEFAAAGFGPDIPFEKIFNAKDVFDTLKVIKTCLQYSETVADFVKKTLPALLTIVLSSVVALMFALAYAPMIAMVFPALAVTLGMKFLIGGVGFIFGMLVTASPVSAEEYCYRSY